jgi:hypothetical protein
VHPRLAGFWFESFETAPLVLSSSGRSNDWLLSPSGFVKTGLTHLVCRRLSRTHQRGLLSRHMHRFVISSSSVLTWNTRVSESLWASLIRPGQDHFLWQSGRGRQQGRGREQDLRDQFRHKGFYVVGACRHGAARGGALTDLGAKYLPAGVKMPVRNRRQITFKTDAQGRATGLVLHPHGMNQPAKRLL